MPNVKVVLKSPITAHRVHTELEFREPLWTEIMSIGDPYVWTPKPGDPSRVVPTPLPESVKEYAERLIVDGDKPGDPLLLTRLGIEDTHAVRDAIMGFFLRVDPLVVAGSTT